MLRVKYVTDHPDELVDATGLTAFFNGTLDEVAYYTHVLSVLVTDDKPLAEVQAERAERHRKLGGAR